MHAKTASTVSAQDVDREAAIREVRSLIPMRYLTDAEYSIISSNTDLETRAAGREFFRVGQDDQFIFYLLSGEIEISNAAGESFKMSGGSTEARYPLCPHRRERTRAVAVTNARFVRFPADLMRLHEADACAPVTLHEISADDEAIENKVLFDVYHAVMDNDLVLPTLPDVAIRIREVANDVNAAVEDVAKIIRADASTAAYCISVANSAAHGGLSKIDNVLDAVVRLGIEPTRDLVVAYTMRSLFDGTSPASKNLMRLAWKHSCRIAALSYILARDVGRLNPERALLAGLLHDIGVTVLIKESQSHPVLVDDPVAFDRVCHELSAQIGAMVLRAWQFPDVFITATLEAELFAKPVAERLQLCDIVMLAHLHDRSPAPWSLAGENLSELAVHSKLKSYDLTDDSRLAVIEEADQEFAELTRLLSG